MRIRKYQSVAVERALKSKSKAMFIVSPAGSGKTLMISRIAKGFRAKGRHVLVLTHRIKILSQIAEQIERDVGEDIGIVGGGVKRPGRPLTLACTGSLRSIDPNEYDVLIVDEAHRSLARSTHNLANNFKERGKKVFGFSATPWRLDGKPMSLIFDKLYVAATYRDLIKKGHILEPQVYSGDPNMLQEIFAVAREGKARKADFTGDELNKFVRKEGLLGNVVEAVQKYLGDRQAVCFGVSIDHCRDMSSRINSDKTLAKLGVTSRFVHSKMTARAQHTVIKDFEKGEFQILFNVDMLSEGWDMPSCEAVIMCRPTLSLSLFIQQALRASRKGDSDRMPLLLDLAWNTTIHGMPYWDYEWSLEEAGAIQRLGDGIVEKTPVTCASCMRVNPPKTKVCIECGVDLVKTGGRVMIPSEMEALELIRIREEYLLKVRKFSRSHNFTEAQGKAFERKALGLLT